MKYFRLHELEKKFFVLPGLAWPETWNDAGGIVVWTEPATETCGRGMRKMAFFSFPGIDAGREDDRWSFSSTETKAVIIHANAGKSKTSVRLASRMQGMTIFARLKTADVLRANDHGRPGMLRAFEVVPAISTLLSSAANE